MQDLNAAWAVLGDPDARARYDRSLRMSAVRPTGPLASERPRARTGSTPAPRPRPAAPKVATPAEMELSGFARLVRPMPLAVLATAIALAVVLAAVFTGGGDGGVNPATARGTTPSGVPLGCITLSPRAEPTPCGNHDAVVWSLANAGESCPEGLEAIYRDGVGGLFCVTLTDQS